MYLHVCMLFSSLTVSLIFPLNLGKQEDIFPASGANHHELVIRSH